MNAPELQQLAAQLLMAAPAQAPEQAGPASDPSNTAPPPVVIPGPDFSTLPNVNAPVAPVIASNMPVTANAVAPADGSVNASVQQSMPIPSTPEQVAAAQAEGRTTAGDGLPLTPQQQAARHAGVIAQDPAQMDQIVHGQEAAARKEQDKVGEELKAGNTRAANAKIKEEHAADSGLADLADIAANDVTAKQKAEEWKINTTNEVLEADKRVRDESLRIAQQNPEDLWGNATTGGKIAGVLGIVAAGLSHPGGATQRLNEMVNQAVAAQSRKSQYLKAYGEANHNLLANAEEVFASRDAAHEAVRSALLQQVSVKVQQAIAGTKDETIKAQLQLTNANVDKLIADSKTKIMQDELTKRITIMGQTLSLEKAQMMANAHAQAGQNRMVTIPGVMDENGNLAQMDVRNGNVKKLQETIGNGSAFIKRTEQMKRFLNKVRHYTKGTDQYNEALAEYNVLSENLQGPYKNLYVYGGAFTGHEKKPLTSMLSALPTVAANFDFLNKITDAKLDAGVNAVKEDLTSFVPSYSGNAHNKLNLNDAYFHAEPDEGPTPTQTAQLTPAQEVWRTLMGNQPEQ